MATSELAQKIARVILDDVTGRRGWRQAWDQFDDDVQAEIKRTWAQLIDNELPRARAPGPQEG